MNEPKTARQPLPRYYAREVKALLDFAGDPTLAAAVGIDVTALDDPETTIPLLPFYELIERAAALTGDPHFGWHLALHWHAKSNRRNSGAVALLLFSSPNLRAMCNHLIRFQRYWNSGDLYEVEERGHEFIIRYRSWGAWREAHRHMAEKMVADILALVRAVEPACQPLAVRFSHAEDGGPCEFEHLMSVRPTYGAAWTKVILPAEMMDKPLSSSDGAVHRLSERYLTMRLSEVAGQEQSYTALVRNAARRALAEGRSDQRSVARLLGCGSRTLQRRLAQEGTTLREIVDEFRRERARALLESKVSIAEVGFALGYSEPSAFQHAFQRWYGVSPKAWLQRGAALV